MKRLTTKGMDVVDTFLFACEVAAVDLAGSADPESPSYQIRYIIDNAASEISDVLEGLHR